MVGSRWPPVGVMAWPAGKMRGPGYQPWSTPLARSTSSRNPAVYTISPRLRTVVKPAMSVVAQFTTPRRVR